MNEKKEVLEEAEHTCEQTDYSTEANSAVDPVPFDEKEKSEMEQEAVDKSESHSKDTEDNPENEITEQKEFVSRDVERFVQAFPHVSLKTVIEDERFLRFCGTRFGREPLAELYQDYRDILSQTEEIAISRENRKRERETFSGGVISKSRLSASEQAMLDEWNTLYPDMKMTAGEFLRRGQ